ncbi:HPr family phosphocarrier protein [Embleya sp. NBC_00896]|uniref:HPr family phosphocarrier protein n=1 Tax=Embleya sp. NBC_00896 TaxID=2975961 RepID=UPI002F910699|nr:HPr family phosphocarrier protein [Embleya sp. NBC_00896]
MPESQQNVVVESINGLHTRPLSMVVKEAKGYGSDITFTVDGRTADAKSLLKLQTLGLTLGKEIVIDARGEDSATAVQALVSLIRSIKE